MMGDTRLIDFDMIPSTFEPGIDGIEYRYQYYVTAHAHNCCHVISHKALMPRHNYQPPAVTWKTDCQVATSSSSLRK